MTPEGWERAMHVTICCCKLYAHACPQDMNFELYLARTRHFSKFKYLLKTSTGAKFA